MYKQSLCLYKQKFQFYVSSYLFCCAVFTILEEQNMIDKKHIFPEMN